MRCLRTVLRIRWQDKVPDTEVLQRAESESIHAILLRSQLRWAGHIQRMDDSRLPKILLYGELTVEQRSPGRPKKRYKDSLKEFLKRFDIPHSTWEASANDHPAWRSLVSAGVLAFEANRIREKDQIRHRRKERSSNPQAGPAPSIPCPHCNRHFRAKIGLFSHLRSHSTSLVICSHGLLCQRRTNMISFVPHEKCGTQQIK